MPEILSKCRVNGRYAVSWWQKRVSASFNPTVRRAQSVSLPAKYFSCSVRPTGRSVHHGHEGFLTFSKAKTVLRRGRFSAGTLIHPPYRRWYQRLMMALFLR